jgi:hypothetical protein
LGHADLTTLQRAYGNQAVGGYVSGLVMRKISEDAMKELAQDLRARLNRPLAGHEIERLLAANVDGAFDNLDRPKRVDYCAKLLSKAGAVEWMRGDKHKGAEPEFMTKRNAFAVSLPHFVGGAKLRFTPAAQYTVFQGRGWISDNVFLRSPNPNVDVRSDLMVHVILEWARVGPDGAPNPHFTIRSSDIQMKLITGKIEGGKDEAMASKEATESSVSVGLGTNPREIGVNMAQKASVQALLSQDNVTAIQEWLRDTVVPAAQEARKG